MINIFQSQKLSLKKIRFSKGKSLFVIVPIAIMFAIIVVATSEAQNLIAVAHNSIFSPIQGQNEVLEINKTAARGFQALTTSSDAGYTATDVSNISSISNVEKASLITKLPIDIVKTTDLFDGKKMTVESLAGLDSEYSKLYTTSDFTYTEGQPIPIILNANDFVEVYEDWNGQTSLTIDFSKQGDPSTTTQGPVKARAITYSRDELIGKTFTMQFGGLTDLVDYKQEPSASGFTYTVKDQATLDAEEATRKADIEKYWDYSKISTPLTYTFVVVGVSEGSDKTTTYIPSAFASKLMQDYLSNEIAARNGTAIPSADQNATYTGLVYDGVTLQKDTTSTIFAGIRNQVTSQVKSQFNSVNQQITNQNSQISRVNSQINEYSATSGTSDVHFGPGSGTPPTRIDFQKVSAIGTLDANSISISFPDESASYAIPGLVYQKDRTSNSITGEYTAFDYTQSLPIASTSILVKLSSVEVRDQVVTDVNSKGYSYTDYSKYKEFDKMEGYLNSILEVAAIVFMVITALFVLINMAKFVSEGRKEIGIFRAIGARKGDIRSIFISQSLLYILISIVVGGLIGVGAVAALSETMVTSSQQFIKSTLGSTITLFGSIAQSNFLSFDVKNVAIYAGLLLLVTLIVSLIPSEQAARVSPVEAIRNS